MPAPAIVMISAMLPAGPAFEADDSAAGDPARIYAAQLFESSTNIFGFSGLSVAVQRDGTPLFFAYRGLAHLNHSVSIRAESNSRYRRLQKSLPA